MATISLLSAKGSPGVTTATVALTLAWSAAHPGRVALAVDADPIGGDTAAGFLRGAVPQGAGVLALATTRGPDLHAALDSAAVRLRADGSARLLPGVPDQARGAALPLAWDVLADLRADLHHAGTDLLVDAGRVDPEGRGAPWLADSDLVVLVVRPSLAAVTAAHRFAAGWPQAGVPLQLLVVAAQSPYGPSEVAGAVGLPLIGVVPFDPVAARVHSEGTTPGRGFERSQYARGMRRVAAEIAGLGVARADRHLPVAAGDGSGDSVQAVGA